MLDAQQRRWARLLDALPGRLGRIDRWLGPTSVVEGGHLHYVPTLVVCLDGMARVLCPLGDRDLRPGEGILIAPGVWHRHEPVRRGCAWFGQGFIATWSDVLILDGSDEWGSRLPVQPSRRTLDRALTASDADCQRMIHQHVCNVLADSAAPATRIDPSARRMIAALHRSAHTGISGGELVRASGRGRSQAYAAFNRAYGITPYQAALQARLGLAEGLLAAGMPVGEVAERTGFASRRAFNRAWRRVHETPPRAGRS